MGKRRKKTRTHVKVDPEFEAAPKTFVLTQHGSPQTEEMVRDFRVIMAPYTAEKLKVRKRNVMKDFVQMAGPLGITHMINFTKTNVGTNMRIGRLPRGPTLTFKVDAYCPIREVQKSQSRPRSLGAQLRKSALLVLNNFSGDAIETKLVTRTFQNMFPSINVSTVDLKQLRRVVLLHNDPENDVVHMRHYEICVRPTGLSKGVKTLLRKNVPDLSKFDDVADFLLKGGEGYESDVSDAGGDNKVVLPQAVAGVGNKGNAQSAIRLVELGPRLELSLLKIEEGFCEGEVLFHKHVKKTPEEVQATRKKLQSAKMLKEQRKKTQAANVERKKKEKEKGRVKSQQAQKKHNAQAGGALLSDSDEDDDEVEAPEIINSDEDYEDDDAEYFRQEVGHEPDADMMLKRGEKYKNPRRDGKGSSGKAAKQDKPGGRGNNPRFKGQPWRSGGKRGGGGGSSATDDYLPRKRAKF